MSGTLLPLPVNLPVVGSRTITTSQTALIDLSATGTVNVIGPAGAPPIVVTLSQTANVGVLETFNITNAIVKMTGIAGVALQTTYNIGDNGTLDFTNVTSLGLGTNIAFTGATGRFVISTVYTPTLLTGFSGFGPGKSIDIVSSLVSNIVYTDNSNGTNTGGTLTVYGPNGSTLNTLPLTTGEYTTRNFGLVPDSLGGTIIEFQSAVTTVTTSPSSGTLGPNATVNFTVSMSNPIVITGGTPSLTLDDGGTAIYNAGLSTPTSIVFTYTVGPTGSNQNSADLNIIGTNLNGATATTVGGGGINTAGIVGNPNGVLVIDTTAPTVASVTVDRPDAILRAGGTVSFSLGLTEPVTITGGSPSLTLNDGGIATFDAANSTTTTLRFRYTVQPGENTNDLTITGANLNNATALDAVGNIINLASAMAINPVGTLIVDTITPTITGITTTPGTGALSAGQTVTLNVALSEPVAVIGNPILTLSDGGTATYDAAHSSGTNLAFIHTVGPNQNTPDLTVTGLTLNGATILDPAGNGLALASAVVNPLGTLVVDTIAPTILGVTTAPNSGAITVGNVVTFNVATTEATVVIGGTPTLTLDDGGTATYDAARSTPNNLVFTYTVGPNQNSSDLGVTSVALNGATLADLAGNVLNFAAAAINPAGTLIVDTIVPTITGITTNPGTGALSAGQTVTLNVALSEPVAVIGTPTLILSDGGTATYDAIHSTPNNLVFTHTVGPNQNTPDLTVAGLTLNGATILDPAGNALALASAVVNPLGTLVIDTITPTITGITTNPGSGTLSAGQTVTLNVTLSESVAVVGTPTLTLSDGGTATYDASHSTPTNLAFTHIVQPGQNASDLSVAGLTLNGATILDPAGNALALASAIVNPVGTLVIDTIAPIVTGVTTNPGSGAVSAGQTVTFNVALSEPVTLVNGTPTLTLSDGGTATYDATNSTPTKLVFTHIVQPGQNATDLGVTAVDLAGATIADLGGNTLNLAAAVINPAGTLVVDTVAPTIGTVTTNPGSGTAVVGNTISFNVPISEALVVLNGIPTLTLSDGGIATYNAALSTPTNLVFDHIVRAGQDAADLAVNGVNLNGASITDIAGNPFDLATALGNPAGILVVDSSLPAVASVTPISASTYLAAGQTIAFDLGLTAAVQLTGTGTPTLTLSDGGIATYDAANSTPTRLRFTNIVQPGQNSADLTITSVNLNGALLSDGTGHILDVTGATLHPTGTIVVDTLAPTIASITATPATGTLSAGQVITFTIDTLEPVTLVNGIPTLTLSDGGIATYDAAHSTPTHMLFTNTVQAGENATNLAISSANLNNAIIADLAGNAFDLASAIGRSVGTLAIDTLTPTITGVTTNPGSGAVSAGQTVLFNVATSEAVILVNGTPTLALNDGGTAIYDAARSTPANLVFAYLVQPNQSVSDLAVSGLALNGAGFTDPAGNALNLADAIVNPVGTLAVDTLAPSITGVTTNPASGILSAGQTVIFNVATSEPVTVVNGVPTLILSDGGTATYDAANSTPTNLVFTHVVQPGQNANDLAITSATIAGTIISDSAGNALNLLGAIGNPAGILKVDSTIPLTPSVRTVTTTPDTGIVAAGQIVSFIVATDSPVFVTGGTPTLALNDGGTAIYNAARSTPTSLVFDTTILPGQTSDDLAVIGHDLNGASIAGANGGPLSLDPTHINPPGRLQVAGGTTPSQPDPIPNGSTTIPTTDPAPGQTPTPTPAVPSTLSIYRFFDSKNGTHFFTSNDQERQNILQTRPDLIPEGENGIGLRAINPASNDPDAIEVFRFFDRDDGTQFLTASTIERDGLIANRPDLVFEPKGSFFEHTQPQPGDTPVYRFFNSNNGTHFYTDSATERLSILQTRPDLIAEGIGFYEPS